MVEYKYPLTDFPNDQVDAATLQAQAKRDVDAELDYLTANAAEVVFHYKEALTNAQKSSLDNVVATHTGQSPTSTIFHASSKFVEGSADVTAEDWETVGGVVTTPAFFANTLENCFSQATGSYKTSGPGAQLRVTEDGSPMMDPFTMNDTGSQSVVFEFQTTTPPTAGGPHLYELQARLNGAASATLSFVSMSLLEKE